MKGTQYYDNFNAIVGLLKEEGLLSAMLQMFVGPVYDLYKDDVNRLIGMGYCMKKENVESRNDGDEYVDYFTKGNNRKYITMSDRFVEYLADVKRKEVGNIWPTLSHTERLLRNIIVSDWSKYESYFTYFDEKRGADVSIDKNKVEHNLLVLHNARNPLAHGNIELLSQGQKDDVVGICDEMTASISAVIGE